MNTFDRIASKFTGRAEMSARLSRELMEEGGLMSASWDVWKASLVNNLMLLAGAFGLISNMYWVRVLSITVSCLLFIALMYSFRTLFQFVVRRVQHPQDRRSLQVLEMLTYVTWTLFPIIQIARDAGYIDTATQFLMMTAADIVAKMMYSINLIFSNFWLMNNADGLMRLDEALFTDALELSRYSQLAATTLEKAKREAESVSALHRAFVANISHELRTPLNSIIAFNSLLLEDDTLTEPQREFVSSAIVSAEALLGIIGQILDFAKLESTSGMHQELVIESFDINEMVNELVDIVGHQANKNQVELVLDVAPELDGLNVRGDKFRLRQALINVINNSIKFTREGGEVRLRVTVLPDDDPVARRISRTSHDDIARGVGRGKSWTMGLALDQHQEQNDEGTNHGADKQVMENDFLAPHAPRVVVAFEVCDNGIGIARDKLKLIFMPFGQASVSSTREYGGTGLGLAITNNIVQSVGGTITCSSELDKGTTMVLSVPLEVRNKVDTARLRQLDPETRVLSVIAKRSLANAIGHAVTCAGAATHVYIEAGARFPHTEHQRKLWSAEVATAIFRAQSRSEGCAILVMEECFLAPLWTEWCRMFRDAPSMPNMPPIVLIVGKKMQVKDILSKEKKLRQNSRGSGGLRQNSFGGFSGIGDSETDLSTLERREEGWRALISSVVQLIRPVKPTLLREALKSAEVMLHQEQARAAANLGQPPSPIAPRVHKQAIAAAPETRRASRGNAPARKPTAAAAVPRRDAVVSPCRVTRSASKRLAASRLDDGADEPAGEAPVNSGLRRRSSVRLRAGNDDGARGGIDPLVPRLPERGWIHPRGAAAGSNGGGGSAHRVATVGGIDLVVRDRRGRARVPPRRPRSHRRGQPDESEGGEGCREALRDDGGCRQQRRGGCRDYEGWRAVRRHPDGHSDAGDGRPGGDAADPRDGGGGYYRQGQLHRRHIRQRHRGEPPRRVRGWHGRVHHQANLPEQAKGAPGEAEAYADRAGVRRRRGRGRRSDLAHRAKRFGLRIRESKLTRTRTEPSNGWRILSTTFYGNDCKGTMIMSSLPPRVVIKQDRSL